MSILEAIANRKSIKHQHAIGRYVEILETGDESHAEELLEIMERLGKTQANVASDLQALRSWDALVSRYETRHAAREKFEEARKTVEKMTVELAAFRAGGGYDPLRDTELERANLKMNQAECDYRSISFAAHHLREMKTKHPELLAGKSLPA